MFTAPVHTRRLPSSRSYWLCLVLLMVFAQIAQAAASCRDYTGCGSGAPHEITNVLDRHHGAGVAAACANELAPADQMAAADPAAWVPVLGPALELAAFWPAAPLLQLRPPAPGPEPAASVPRFLSLGRLLR